MTDFIRQIIDRDLAAGRYPGGVVTRFPPEPNGFLHIGHAKSIVLNFGLTQEYAPARCHLRFDDTNPITEDETYARAIQEDVRWLGYDWGEHLYFASDYFEEMYAFAEHLIQKGLAYVDGSSEEEIREGRGTVTRPGTPSRDRDRSPEESLDLFRRMRAGEFPDGTYVLRARIDMASPNMLMRDPVLYRIRHAHHYRTGDAWCLYPLYDYAHCLEDALEGVTHSLCTLEFDNNRELYDWVIDNTPVPNRPHQYEFARLNLDYTVMSKRKLLRLVGEGDVAGWDDPRMPTLAGLRRRGVTPEAVRTFCEMIGVAKADSRVDMGKLEYAIRDDLNARAPRVLAVLDPLKVVITNWPAGEAADAGGEAGAVEWLDASYWPHDIPKEGTRPVPLTREIYIEREDFSEHPPKGYRRLVPGGAVRLRHAYVVVLEEIVKDASGTVQELRVRYLPQTRSGSEGGAAAEVKPRGTIQWVSATHGLPCQVNLYDRLFSVPDPDAAAAESERDFRDFLNPDALRVVAGAWVEPSVGSDAADTRYQFERLGYFWRDPGDAGAAGGGGTDASSTASPSLVFNRIVTLRDTWAREQEAATGGASGMTAIKGGGAEKGAGKKGTGGEGRDGAGKREGAPPPPVLTPEEEATARGLVERFALTPIDAAILARDEGLRVFLEETVAAAGGGDRGAGLAISVANLLIHTLPPLRKGRALADLALTPAGLARLVALMEDGTLSSRGGSLVLEAMVESGGDPEALTREMDLVQEGSDDVLRPLVAGVIADFPDKVAAYRGGKTGLLGFFMGQLMQRSGGKADPERARVILEEALRG